MLAHTKTHLTDNLIPLTLFVHPINVDRIKRYVARIEPEEGSEGSITADEYFTKYFRNFSITHGEAHPFFCGVAMMW